MGITNDTNEQLAVSVRTSPPIYTIFPGESLSFSLNGLPGDCTEWELRATTADGVVAAQVGPPVCDGDSWTITQAELDQAREDAGIEAPDPTPFATPTSP
ncbi:hypothetical protein ACTHAM_003024 [Cellulomonas soli]|uniref:hypothetical protein n=1 Tax=Cellulomonas soli TaxID=931535 RepID=UPI001D52E5E4|nr:hypothetical protein [Cellulomonadaceae bacterium]